MRKIGVLSAAMMLALFISCNNKPKEKESTTETETEQKEVKAAEEKQLSYETVTIKKEDKKTKISFEFTVDYPNDGPENLVRAIRKEILNNMGRYNVQDLSKEGLNKVADQYISETIKEQEDLEIDYSEFPTSSSFQGEIKMNENTKKYVTYFYSNYAYYAGAAHGIASEGYFTIDKEDCKVLTLNDVIAADKKAELERLIKSHLAEDYYKGEEPGWKDSFVFALPTALPGITSKGIGIYYKEYEIDCYAAGMPHCIIPFDEMNDLITDRVKKLIK